MGDGASAVRTVYRSRSVAAVRAAVPVLALLLSAPVGALDESVLSPAYAAVLARYAGGERTAAIADLSAWPEARLRAEITRLAALRQFASACVGCPAADAWERLPLRAGLMLHADAALAERRDGGLARLQESAALEYARLLADDPRHATFVRSWLEATVGIHHAEMRWGPALDWADRALAIVPDSPPVRLAVAAIEEMQGALVTSAPRYDAYVDPVSRGMRARLEAGREARLRYRAAREAARAALDADPASLEARVRLGRIAWRLGDTKSARAELDAVVASADEGPFVFLAHLFLGRLAEDAGRLPEAMKSYEAALAILPGSQSAGVALSQARHRQGDVAGAREALQRGVRDERRQEADPFWLYPFGAARDAETRLEALRRDLRP